MSAIASEVEIATEIAAEITAEIGSGTETDGGASTAMRMATTTHGGASGIPETSIGGTIEGTDWRGLSICCSSLPKLMGSGFRMLLYPSVVLRDAYGHHGGCLFVLVVSAALIHRQMQLTSLHCAAYEAFVLGH